MHMPHCTRVPHRQSPDHAWPLRRADGTRFHEPRRDAHIRRVTLAHQHLPAPPASKEGGGV